MANGKLPQRLRTQRGEKDTMAARQSIALSVLLQAYLDDMRVRAYKPKTINGYRKKVGRFVRWAESVHAGTLKDLTPERVKAYITYLQQQKLYSTHPIARRTEQPLLSPSAIRNYVRDLKAFSSWLAQEQYTPTDVLESVKKPKADETPIEPFTDDEIMRIFASLDPTDEFGLRDYVLLHTLWDTGLRVGELVNLTLQDIDLQRCQIRIAHAKFGKWRDVGFGKQTHKYLTRYLSIGRPEPLFEDEQHFFLTFDGRPLTEQAVERVCARLSKRTGIHIHCHRFRHTFAVNMLRNGTDIRTLQRLMGHASIQILTRYLNLANADTIQTHQNNSPADRFYAQRQAGVRRLPVRRSRQLG